MPQSIPQPMSTEGDEAVFAPSSQPPFTRRIKAPTDLALYVGKTSIKYSVHEDILCELPSFQAALRGEFKEASAKEINMPEDDPTAVLALLEWLYTQDYRHVRSARFSMFRGLPKEDARKELRKFTLKLSATAHKYDCDGLCEKANKAFDRMADELDGMEKLLFWRVAYTTTDSVRLPDYEFEHRRLVETRYWVQQLCSSYPEELRQTLLDIPDLVIDLLKAASNTSFMESHMEGADAYDE